MVPSVADSVKISHQITEVYKFTFGGNSSAVNKIKAEHREPNQVLVNISSAPTQNVCSDVKPCAAGAWKLSEKLTPKQQEGVKCSKKDGRLLRLLVTLAQRPPDLASMLSGPPQDKK